MYRRTVWAGRGWRGRFVPAASTHLQPPPVTVSAAPLVLVRVVSRPPDARRTGRSGRAGLVATTTLPAGWCCPAIGGTVRARAGHVRAVRVLRPGRSDSRRAAGAGAVGPTASALVPADGISALVAAANEAPGPP